MNEYWEITRERGLATQAVWAMQPTFKLKKLDQTQHGALVDSLPVLAQARDDAENNLTDSLAAARTVFEKLSNIDIRLPGIIDGVLDDEDDLKDQLDAIYAIDPSDSENASLRRARLVLPFWTDTNAACAAAVPPEPPITLDYQGVTVAVADFSATINAALAAQKTVAEQQRLVTNAKSALRTADRKTDRGNKRWYKAWLKAYPPGTPEGDAAQSQVPTEQGQAQAQVLAILSVVAQPNHTFVVSLDPAGGGNADTKELQYQLPGEPEFGHSTPITSNTMTVGPFAVGVSVSFRTRVSNSNAGFVTSPVVAGIV